MGGDHKCPVCQATFTRPQHVARHMRSHTGDRPYKCQYCGDQFARSDLLSRHVNKCHANEKPVPTQGRRKGSASASRATTSKQACDQCVQSSLPCDGSNPCAKCVQRKCRCTYVKFHRQTAPVGPGHNPRSAIPPNPVPGPPSATLSSSSRLPMSYQPDEFFLQPPPSNTLPSVADTLYASQSFSFPPLYPDPATGNTDFTSKYRAQAELLRNGAAAVSSSAHFPPTGGTGGPVGPGIPGNPSLSPPHLYNDPRSTSGGSSWVSWGHDGPDSYHAHGQQDPLHDKDMHHGHDSLSHRSHHHHHPHQPYVNSHALQHSSSSSSGAGTYPHQVQPSAAYLRRGSVEFGDSSEGSPTTAEHSIPSSAASSNVHLPLDNLTMQHHPLSYNTLENHRADFTGAASTESRHDQHSGLHSGEPGVSSALGLMSLDDPNLLAGLTDEGASSFFPGMNMNLGGISSLSAIPADDPDATPMPLKENPSQAGVAPPVSMTVPMRSSSAGGTRDGDLKELREFWKQYMRTPFSGPGPANGGDQTGSSGATLQPPQPSVMSPPGYRRPRVASMPSSKTPTIALSLQQQQQQNDPSRGESGMRTTLHDDLRSYEAAVMARKAPTNLNLNPKMRRGTVPGLPPPHHHDHNGSPIVGVVPLVKFDMLHQRPDTRPSSSSTNRSGSSGDGSSLSGAFGLHHQRQQQLESPNLVSQFTMRRGSPASSTSTTGGSSSRASSVSIENEDRDNVSDDGGGGSGDSGRVGRLRPAFKRLASTTLGPVNVKRTAYTGSVSPTIEEGEMDVVGQTQGFGIH